MRIKPMVNDGSSFELLSEGSKLKLTVWLMSGPPVFLGAPVINLGVCIRVLFIRLHMRTLLIRFVHMCVLFGTGTLMSSFRSSDY